MISDEGAARRYVGELCDEAALARLDRLAEALREENERQNLVSRATLEALWQRHLADSAQLLEFVPRETGIWLDLGSGAGLPGLVIAAMRPAWRVVLVESRRKRVAWLEGIRAELELARCRIEGRRLELVEGFAAGVISARAFAPLPRLLDLSRRFSTKHTLWLLPKGRSAEQELAGLPQEWQRMFHVERSRTDAEARILVGQEAKPT